MSMVFCEEGYLACVRYSSSNLDSYCRADWDKSNVCVCIRFNLMMK